jgi:hypothetical protein
VMSDVSPKYRSKRTSADHSEFMDSRRRPLRSKTLQKYGFGLNDHVYALRLFSRVAAPEVSPRPAMKNGWAAGKTAQRRSRKR